MWEFHGAMGWNTWGQDFGLFTFGRCLLAGSMSFITPTGAPGQDGFHRPGLKLPALSFLDSAPASSLRAACGSAKLQPKPGRGWCISSPGLLQQSTKDWWLKTAEVHSLQVLEAASPKSRCQEGLALPSGSRGESSFTSSSFWYLLAVAGVHWLVGPSL